MMSNLTYQYNLYKLFYQYNTRLDNQNKIKPAQIYTLKLIKLNLNTPNRLVSLLKFNIL